MEKKKYISPAIKVYNITPNVILVSSIQIQNAPIEDDGDLSGDIYGDWHHPRQWGLDYQLSNKRRGKSSCLFFFFRISSATLSIFFCVDFFSFSSISFFEGGCGFEVPLLLVSLLSLLFVLLLSTFRYLVSTFGSGVSTLCFLVSTHCPLFSLPNILALTLHRENNINF